MAAKHFRLKELLAAGLFNGTRWSHAKKEVIDAFKS